MRLASVAATFAATVHGWFLFRITEWSRIVDYTHALFTDFSLGALGALSVFSIGPYLMLSVAIDIVESRAVKRQTDDVRQSLLAAPYIAALVVAVAIFGSESGGDFIYFKF